MKRAAVRLLVALVLLEGALQLGDWLRWRRHLVRPEGPPVAGRVLVVGAEELFDVGVRSRTDSWPVEAGQGIADVRNFAHPGADSATLLEELPAWLAAERPQVVYIGVGGADFARGIARAMPREAVPGRSLPHRPDFRIGAIVAALLGARGNDQDGDRSLVGDWHHGEVAFSFGADGIVHMQGRAAAWSVDGDELVLGVPGAPDARVPMQFEGERIVLGEPLHVTLERGRPFGAVEDRVRDAIRSGDWFDARRQVETAVRSAGTRPGALAVAVDLARREGRTADAGRWLAALREGFDADGGAAWRRALVDALGAVDEHEEALRLAAEDWTAVLADPAVLRRIGRGVDGADAATRFASEMKTLATDGDLPAATRATVMFAVADALEHTHPNGAIEAALDGILALPPDAEPDPREFPRVLARIVPPWDDPPFERYTAAEAGRLIDAVARFAELDLAITRALEHNLGIAVEVARFYGAEPVLLDAAGFSQASRARAAVARRLDVPSIGALSSDPAAALRDDMRQRVR